MRVGGRGEHRVIFNGRAGYSRGRSVVVIHRLDREMEMVDNKIYFVYRSREESSQKSNIYSNGSWGVDWV